MNHIVVCAAATRKNVFLQTKRPEWIFRRQGRLFRRVLWKTVFVCLFGKSVDILNQFIRQTVRSRRVFSIRFNGVCTESSETGKWIIPLLVQPRYCAEEAFGDETPETRPFFFTKPRLFAARCLVLTERGKPTRFFSIYIHHYAVFVSYTAGYCFQKLLCTTHTHLFDWLETTRVFVQ